MAHVHGGEPDWLHGHAHDPNPKAPSPDPDFTLRLPGGQEQQITLADLHTLPLTTVPNCLIVSTGHGASGPFEFAGVRLRDLVAAYLPPALEWHYADAISADGFGNRIFAHELSDGAATNPILLAHTIDGIAMTRAQGLVRLIVPSETDDALRQVKWLARVEIHTHGE